MRHLAALALLAAALPGCRGGHEDVRRYASPDAWSASIPVGMHVEHSGAQARAAISESTFANFPVRKGVWITKNGWHVKQPAPANGRFPADGVALRMLEFEGGPPAIAPPSETRFPLSYDDFAATDFVPTDRPRPLAQSVVADGRHYMAMVWTGPRARKADREALARITRSIAFRHLREGEQGHPFTVLGLATRYPVGSFTRIQPRGWKSPLYLVHAPGGLYAVGRYGSGCRLQLDAFRKELFCPAGQRWDRVGRPLTPGREPLSTVDVTVSWDGHVLLTGSSTRADERLAHKLWPGWSGA